MGEKSRLLNDLGRKTDAKKPRVFEPENRSFSTSVICQPPQFDGPLRKGGPVPGRKIDPDIEFR
jgi:hypothetical protein